MKLAFFLASGIPVHARTLDERPLGGLETAFIRLCEALYRLGHNVVAFTPLERPPLSLPIFLPQRAIGDLGKVDVFVAIREWPTLLSDSIDAKLKCYWTGDAANLSQTVGIGDIRVASSIDLLLPVSAWHAKNLTAASGFPVEKCLVLRNGVSLDLFTTMVPRARKRLLYTSTPFRGLELLLKIFPIVRQKHPDAELHVCSGWGVYHGAGPQPEAAFAPLFNALEKLPGCKVVGNVKQSELAKEFLGASILAYPCTFEETSCISAIEAMAAGCPVVTTKLGALPETLGDAAIFIDPPGDGNYSQSESYIESFVNAVDTLLGSDDEWSKISERGRMRSLEYDWLAVAKDFVQSLGKYVCK